MESIRKDQEFLQSAQATLVAETREMVNVSNRLHDNIVRAMRLMWRQLFFIWALVLALLIAYFLVLHKSSPTWPLAGPASSPQEKAAPSAGIMVSPQPPATPPANKTFPIGEKDVVAGILEQVREAQLKKNIDLFLQAYAPSFPNLEKKKESILKTWEKYDYLDMHFTIENIRKSDANTIVAKVVWDITLEDISSKKRSTLVRDYVVHLTQFSGKWLIQELIQGEQTSEIAARYSRRALPSSELYD